jgi:two-component system response regulator NreC
LPADALTERELEVLKLVAEGLTNRQIAAKLSISIKTVQSHRANLMDKLDLHDRTELVRYAIRRGLITA